MSKKDLSESDIRAKFITPHLVKAGWDTKETADLFLALFIRLLKKRGRAAIFLPDCALFGEGVKTRLREQLLTECNLHTIVRPPNRGVWCNEKDSPLRPPKCRTQTPPQSSGVQVQTQPTSAKVSGGHRG